MLSWYLRHSCDTDDPGVFFDLDVFLPRTPRTPLSITACHTVCSQHKMISRECWEGSKKATFSGTALLSEGFKLYVNNS